MTSEADACVPITLATNGFNDECLLPYGLTIRHVRLAMAEFLDFLGFINQQLHTKNLPRLESFLMPANFSSLVGEFMNLTIPKALFRSCAQPIPQRPSRSDPGGSIPKRFHTIRARRNRNQRVAPRFGMAGA